MRFLVTAAGRGLAISKGVMGSAEGAGLVCSVSMWMVFVGKDG